MHLIIPPIVIFIIFLPLVKYLLQELDPREQSTSMKIAFLALVVRIGAVFTFSLFLPQPWKIQPDTGPYIHSGIELAKKWRGDPDNQAHLYERRLEGQHPAYYLICGGVFTIFGTKNVYSPAYVNSLMGVISILLIFLLLRRWFAWKIARNFLLISSFVPSSIFWQSFPMKDTAVLFLVVVTFYNYINFLSRRSISSLFFILLAFFPLYFIRYYIVFVIIFSMAATTFLYAGELSLKRIVRSLLIFSFGIIAAFAVGMGSGIISKFEDEASIEKLEYYRSVRTSSRAAVFEDHSYKTAGDVIKYLPIRLVTFLFAPFPWQIYSVRTAVSFIEMPFWWFLFPFVIKGLVFMLRHKHAKIFIPLVIYTVSLSLLFTLGSGNLGNIYRLRSQVLPFFLFMGTVGLSLRKAKKLGIPQINILSTKLRIQQSKQI